MVLKHEGIDTENLNNTKDLLEEGLEPAEQQEPLKDGDILIPKTHTSWLDQLPNIDPNQIKHYEF